MYMKLKDGKSKVLTLSYDDGVVQDIRLMEILADPETDAEDRPGYSHSGRIRYGNRPEYSEGDGNGSLDIARFQRNHRRHNFRGGRHRKTNKAVLLIYFSLYSAISTRRLTGSISAATMAV